MTVDIFIFITMIKFDLNATLQISYKDTNTSTKKSIYPTFFHE